MADTKIKDLTSKTPIVATDEFVINDASGGNLDKKATGAGIKTFVKDGLVASDVTDFDTEVSNNSAVAANTAKTSNATHTGDVTGSTALTIAAKAVDVAMLADGTDGELITWGATGVAETVAVGTATHVLTSNGTGAAPTFQAAAGGGHTIEDEGTPLTARSKLNFVGTGVTVTDDAGDDATDVTISAGGDALTANPLSQFAQTTSLELKNTISDETGSGALVFATSPTLVAPALGTPASGVATNLTGTAGSLTSGTCQSIPSLSGDVTSSGNVVSIANDAIVNLDINISAAINFSKLEALTSGNLIVGNGGNVASSVAMSGDVTISNGGVTTIADNAVSLAKMAGGTAGNIITFDASGDPAAVATGTATHVLTSNGVGLAPTFQANPAGFADPMTTRGDIIFKNSGGTTTRLAAGTNTQVLTSDGTDISWEDAAGGGDTVVGTQVLEVDASALYPGGDTPAVGVVTKMFGAQSQPIRAIELSDGEDQEVYWQGKLNNWNAGTIKVKAYWFVENDLATPESTTFELDCSGVSLANFDGIGGTAYGTAITITDTTDSTAAENKINISPASTAVTIAGATAAEWLSIKMVRTASTDTAGTVFLAGISIEYTISTGTATI